MECENQVTNSRLNSPDTNYLTTKVPYTQPRMPIQETNKELVEKPVGILQEEEKEEPILSHTEDEDDDDDDDEDEDDKINKVIWQFNILNCLTR